MSTGATDVLPDEPGRVLVLVQAVLATVIGLFSVLLVGNVGLSTLDALGVAADSRLYRVVTSALSPLGFALGVGVYLTASGDRELVAERVRRPTTRDTAFAVAGVLVLLVAAVAIDRVVEMIGIDVASNAVVVAGERDPTLFLYLTPITLLLVGPAEELLFRGVVQGLLSRAYRPASAVVIASAVFGAIHLPALIGSGSVTYIVAAALLGLVLGAAYELTDNIVVPAAAHGVYNAILFAGLYAASTGIL